MGVLKVVRAAEQSGDQSLDSVEEMMERCGDWGLLPLIYPVQCVAWHLVPGWGHWTPLHCVHTL